MLGVMWILAYIVMAFPALWLQMVSKIRLPRLSPPCFCELLWGNDIMERHNYLMWKTQVGNVHACPVTKEAWDARAEARKAECGRESVYHCLSDSEGRKWEKCVKGYCPVFTSDGYIDWKQCNISESTGCPNSSYVSDEVYKHPWCFGNNNPLPTEQTNKNISGVPGLPLYLIAIVVGILFIIGTVITIVIINKCRRRKRQGHVVREELTKFLRDGNQEDVVNEHNILGGLSVLSRENVKSIVVQGIYGNAVSSTSRRILEKIVEFLNEKTKMKWACHQCRYTDIPDTVDENTVLFVYGWFGFWNDDLCSVDAVEIACQKLEQILKQTKTVKLIIGMRSDLFKYYNMVLRKYEVLFKHEIYLDSVNVDKDADYFKYFQENIKGPCKKKTCPCEMLTFEMFQKGNDSVVGMPLKLNIIAHYHDLVFLYISDWDILKVTANFITVFGKTVKMKQVYGWIKYICLNGKFSRSEEFYKDLVKDLNWSSFDETDTNLRRFVRMRKSDQQNNVSSEDAQYVFWHPFIYICVFHSLFKEDPQFVLRHCNVDAILQLVRPKGTETSYFEVAADDQGVNLFNERLRQLGLLEKYRDHPLVKVSASV